MNTGAFKLGNVNGKIVPIEYIKYVRFAKAVLWKDKELSLPVLVFHKIENLNLPYAVFIDRIKKEAWYFKTTDIREHGKVKTEGQEPQYYFPIELARKENI